MIVSHITSKITQSTHRVSVQPLHFAGILIKLKKTKAERGLKHLEKTHTFQPHWNLKYDTDVQQNSGVHLTRGGAVAVGCRKGVKCWCVCVCWCWWLC